MKIVVKAFILILTAQFAIAASTTSPLSVLEEVPMIWVPELLPDILMTNGFKPHQGFKGTNYRIEPIHRNHSPIDYIAWHDESWNELRTVYGPAWDWPREMTESQNANDLEKYHYNNFLNLSWITYEILSLDGKRALGSIYLTPESCGVYGARAMYWITTPLRGEIEATFHAEMKQWLNTVWPWQTTYFPGPEVSDEIRGQLYKLMDQGVCQ